MNSDFASPVLPVPKLIFLTWKVRLIPQAVRRCVDSFKERNPAWTVVVMSDEDCLAWLAARRPADLAWYEALPKGILRADAVRLLWLHEMGGIYADIDVECLRPLDELAGALEPGKTLGLTRDHPIHERIHFSSTPMWMNDFMVARPGSTLIGEALRQLAVMVGAGIEFNSRNAVMETGPGLLNRALRAFGDLEAAGVQYLPWEQIHPLPDMTNTFDEKVETEIAIKTRNWRGADPWVSHYWYHTWCSTRNMVVSYSDCLFADREEAAMERLNKYRKLLGPRSTSVCEALKRLAALDKPVTLVEFGVARSFISEPPPGVDGAAPIHWQPHNSAAWDWGAGCFTRVAIETLAGYEFQYHGVDPSPVALSVAKTMLSPLAEEPGIADTIPGLVELLGSGVLAWAGAKEMDSRVHFHQETAESFLTSFEGEADLIYMDHGECSEETARMHRRDAQNIVERGLVREGGLVLIDDHAHEPERGLVAKSLEARAVFEEAGWGVVLEGLQLLMQRPYEVPEYIPRTLHVYCEGRRLAAYGPDIPAAWRALHPDWEFMHWDDEKLRDFITAECPWFLETFVEYRTDCLRMQAGMLMVIKKKGGIAVTPDMMPLRCLDELLAGQHLVLAARVSQDDPAPSGADVVRIDFIASSADHPFWNGLEHDLKLSHRAEPSAAAGSQFLNHRLRDSLRFLSPETEWPELVGKGVVIDFNGRAGTAEGEPNWDSIQSEFPDAWLVKVPAATLQRFSRPRSESSFCHKTISVAIMTVQRPEPYLHNTVVGLRKEWPNSGENPLLLFLGSPANEFIERYRSADFVIQETSITEWAVIQWWNPHRKAMWNYWRCLREERPGFSEIGRLVLEDDVEFANGWKGRLLTTLEAVAAEFGKHFVLSLYSPRKSARDAWIKGDKLFLQYPPKDFFGTQAVFFTDSVRRDFAEYLKAYGVDDNLLPYDIMLADYCERTGVPLLMSVPSLVQHVGFSSTGLGSIHQSPSFVKDLSMRNSGRGIQRSHTHKT